MDEFEEKIRKIDAEHRRNKIITIVIICGTIAISIVSALNYFYWHNLEIGFTALAFTASLAIFSFIRMRRAKKRLDATMKKFGLKD